MMNFAARTVRGAGRGTSLGSPTINLHLDDIPDELPEGVFAVLALIDSMQLQAVMHHGPRPAFDDTKTCEVHVLDQAVERAPTHVEIQTVERIRDIEDFPDADALKRRIHDDIQIARAMLARHAGST